MKRGMSTAESSTAWSIAPGSRFRRQISFACANGFPVSNLMLTAFCVGL